MATPDVAPLKSGAGMEQPPLQLQDYIYWLTILQANSRQRVN